MFSKIFPKIHTEGYRFLIISGVATLVFYALSTFLGLLGLVITIWVYYFFRDPDRTSINDDKYLVSPADGEIIKVEEVDGPKELGLEDRKFKKISIFMNVFDCHVNRTPCSGKIDEILKQSKTVLWNGPFGLFEYDDFANGTNDISRSIAKYTKNNNLISVAGGGDTFAAIKKSNQQNNFTYISTAGGAFLEWLEGKMLPGLKVLEK